MVDFAGFGASRWSDPRLVVTYLGGFSLVVFGVHVVAVQSPLKKLFGDQVSVDGDDELNEDSSEFDSTVVKKSTARARKLQVLRFLCLLCLLSVAGYEALKKHKELVDGLLFGFYLYTTFLSLLTIFCSKKWRNIASTHLSLLNLVLLGVYVYRDLVPLAMRKPSQNATDGWLGSARLALLLISGLLTPLSFPAEYKPLDPKNPMTPSDEQLASYLSKATFSFVGTVIYKAYKTSNVSTDELPPLADVDRSRHLVKSSFPLLDPVLLGRKRHIFWGILIYFKKVFATQFLLCSVQVINDFASPVATQQILAYLETNGTKSALEPWVWISWLAFGPVISSVCTQTYLYLTTVVYVRGEAILTQLIFDHSLRVRLNSHAPSEEKAKEGTPLAATPISEPSALTSVDDETDSAVHASASGTAADEATLQGSVSNKSTDTATPSSPKNNDKPSQSSVPTTAKKVEDQTGRLMTMLTSDLKNLTWGFDFMMPFFSVIHIVVCTVFLYTILGWSALVGIGFIIITLPLPGFVASLLMTFQKEKMKRTDARIQAITQIMNVLRMVKLFAWESKVQAQLAEKREVELQYIRNGELIDIANNTLNSILPLATIMVTCVTYTLVMKGELTASRIFPAMAVFNIFRNNIGQIFWEIPSILRAKVSLDRIGEYLSGGELFEDSEKPNYAFVDRETLPRTAPAIQDATFTWYKPNTGSETPGRRNFRLQVEGELKFKEGSINLICGPTGSGKTSLLMALLGEMYFHPYTPTSFYHLPREGGVAYAAQESWVINDTIKQNILFRSPFDKERYEKVIHQTGLERDLSLLSAGDLTEVGEKGITLSGGQKARITLARAVYSDAKIVLLDDVLSALDVHTSKWITEKCLGGELLRGRTVLLVTHNILLVEPISDCVVSLSLDGKISSRESIGDALRHSSALQAQALKEESANEAADDHELETEKKEDQVESGKLILAEEMAIGHVSLKAIKLYLSSLGGLIFFLIVGPAFVLAALLPVVENWFLGFWSSQYDYYPDGGVPVKLFLLIYGMLLLSDALLNAGGQTVYIFGAIRASRSLHKRLITSILSSTFRWLDTVPISRVITRCSQDCQTIDGMFPSLVLFTTFITLTLIVSVITVIVSAGWPALPPAIAVLAIALGCGHIYINAQMPLKRNMSNNKAPILSNVGTVLGGIVSVRAYGAQSAFRDESLRRIDNYSKTSRVFWNLNRWIGFRMDTIGGLFAGVIATWLVYGRSVSAGNVGFTLTVLGSFSGYLLIWIRMVNETEVQANSLERIQEYLDIDHEKPAAEDGKPPAYWPASGELHVEHLSARYSLDGPEVLKDISFRIASGERVGVVGRTGAGKSTVALALLRAIPTEGTVIYDGLKTANVNLDALRSNITIIPQHPELLNGTLRENLDPFSEHDDATLNYALRAAGLFRLQEEGEEGGISLDTEVQAGGSNFSQGQRQIIALARAIIRRSKLLILDEATAAIDHETDQAIQHSIRSELKDVSVITVAHRLRTIMDSDKIMVLDAGKLIEFDSPQNLLKKKQGLFYRLVEESSDKDELYSLAGM